MMTLKQWGALLRDPRLPWRVPAFLWKRWRFARAYPPVKNGTLRVAITVDVEHDAGSCGAPSVGQTHDLRMFLRNFQERLKALAAKATFYVQGDLVESLAPELHTLVREGHELGLHGLHHELWGNVWFFKDRPLTLAQMKDALAESLAAFKRAGLPRPTDFRAPNMVLNPRAYAVLEDAGFTLDSSPPSYQGVWPLPFHRGKLGVIPVTADPRPRFRRVRSVIPMTEFTVCNVHNVVKMTPDEWCAYAERVGRFQIVSDVVPHLVFLAHPWEFKKIPQFSYCSPKNEAALFERLNTLEKSFDIEWVTLRDLSKKLHVG